jgi:hypothetical protein
LTDTNWFIEMKEIMEGDDDLEKEEEVVLMPKAWKVKVYVRIKEHQNAQNKGRVEEIKKG